MQALQRLVLRQLEELSRWAVSGLTSQKRLHQRRQPEMSGWQWTQQQERQRQWRQEVMWQWYQSQQREMVVSWVRRWSWQGLSWQDSMQLMSWQVEA